MRRRFKSIFKKDLVEDTKTDKNVPTKQAGLANKIDNAPISEPSRTNKPENLNLEDGVSSGQSDSTSSSLWDTAYDQLKEEEDTRKLLVAYEGLLSGVPIKGKESVSGSNKQLEDESFENQIPQHDPIARRKVLNEIAKAGLQHMEDNQAKITLLGHQISMQEGVGKVGKAVDWTNTFISAVVKDLPYAPAVTAGISLILPLLKNPSDVDDANLQGFAYVTSQMSFYAQMEAHLLPSDMPPGLKLEMTNGVIGLYRLVIEYQTRSVLRFYRNSTKNYFRSVVNYDGWEDQLSRLKEKEAALTKRFVTVFSSSSLEQLKQLSEEAKAMRQALSTDLHRLLDLSQSAEQRSYDEEFRRCIDALKVVNPEHDKDRIQDEKGGLLEDSYRWVVEHADFKKWRDEQDAHLLWIKGDPGKGKTMLLCGIIDELSKTKTHGVNIAYFFCQATNSRIREASTVLRGLIYALVHRQPSLIAYLRDGRFEGDTAWFELRKVLTKILDDPNLQPTYLIIDALDECEVDLDKLLDFLVENSSSHARVKWVISSRNLPDIERDLERTPKSKLCLELNEDTVSAAVDSFIDYKVNGLSKKNRYEPEVRDAVNKHLKANAGGTFLWVALVCQRIAKVAGRHARKKLEDNPPGLTALYRRMLDQIDQSDDADYCRSILSVTLTVFRPITLEELASCIDLPQEIRGNTQDLEEILRNCGSFLTLRENVLSLVHQSAKDFLTEKPVFEIIFPEGTAKRHYSIFAESMRAMSATLRRNIYDLADPGFPISQLTEQKPDPLAGMYYPCLHWIGHFQQSISVMNTKLDLQDGGLVGNFFRQDYLHWLEALSLLRSFPAGVASILELDSFLKKVAEGSYLTERVHDASRFILYFKTGIESYPLQAYNSALVFSPTSSITRDQFRDQKPLWLAQEPVVEEVWDACLHTLEIDGFANSITFSHDSALIASACYRDNTIKLWDAKSGQRMHTLKGHDERVEVVFAPLDSGFLASVGCDMTVELWDTHTGKCVHTIPSNGDRLHPFTVSPDLKLVAFKYDSDIKAIEIWDINGLECVQTLKDPSHLNEKVAFSDNSKLLVSSEKCYIRIWESHSGRCLHTLETDYSLTFGISRDSKILASKSPQGHTLELWDCCSGECIQTLEGYGGLDIPITFSHDSKLLATLSDFITIKVWDIKSGDCLQTFQGHTNEISSLAFSPDSHLLASGSADKTVKVWRIDSQQHVNATQGHTQSVKSVVFSADSKLLASCSWDNTIKVWNARNDQCIQTFIMYRDSSQLESVAFSHDSRLLVCGGEFFDDSDENINSLITLWDLGSSKCIRTIKLDHTESFELVVFSSDSRLIASNSEWDNVAVWNMSDGQCIHILRGHTKPVKTITFSDDSMLLASGSYDREIKLWDLSEGKCIRTLKGHPASVNSVIFSPDSKLLASHSVYGTVKIWDTTNGCCLKTITTAGLVPEQITKTSARIKSFDLSAGYLNHDFGVIRFDCNSHEVPGKTRIDAHLTFEGLSISSDESWITWNSKKLLWLPPEYRPQRLTVSHSKMVFAFSSGRMLFFGFDSHKLSEILP